MNKLKFIFVHGLSGWGSYDKQYQKMPYWGMRKGDLMGKLRQDGFQCYSGSVSPHGSCYDRACELYGQLAGKRVDYGKKHSERYGHPQYGTDFTGRGLIDKLDEDTRLVLIGHSFGGATIRTFAHIIDKGVPEEDGTSDFFNGGHAKNVFAVVCIASPHNGTTAYDMYEDPEFDITAVKPSLKERFASNLMGKANSGDREKLIADDCAAYDMHIDNALKINQTLSLNDDTYYFSQPCSITVLQKDGTHYPIEKETEIMFTKSSKLMGRYEGKTAGGFVVDKNWRENDGLVNTVSAAYPFYQPHKIFDPADIEKGTWNVFETYHGDHMSLQGGMIHVHDIYPYYRKLVEMISSLND